MSVKKITIMPTNTFNPKEYVKIYGQGETETFAHLDSGEHITYTLANGMEVTINVK